MDNNTNQTETKNYITVNPKEWQGVPKRIQNASNHNPWDWKNESSYKTVWDRFFMSNPFEEKMVEVLSVGTWEWIEPSEIASGIMQLEKNTEYHFVFWLNGGENDRSDETCELQVMFSNANQFPTDAENESRLCYRLNRNYIKPLKRKKGWELYDISFTTADIQYVQFRFVACRAPMTVMAAKNPEEYAEWKDEPDIYADRRPQRHNMVFEDGWPTNQWYSTKALTQG